MLCYNILLSMTTLGEIKMQYNVSIQGKFYKQIEAEDTLAVLRIISKDISENKIEWLDLEQPHGIEIKPVGEGNTEE